MSGQRPMILALVAVAALVGGWGSCGGTTFGCHYACAASEAGGGTATVSSSDQAAAEQRCAQDHRGTCPDFSCQCIQQGAQ